MREDSLLWPYRYSLIRPGKGDLRLHLKEGHPTFSKMSHGRRCHLGKIPNWVLYLHMMLIKGVNPNPIMYVETHSASKAEQVKKPN